MSENKNAKTPADNGQVAHVYLFDKTGRPMVAWDNAKDIKLGDKLYAAPKQWVELTKEETLELFEKYSDKPFSLMLATYDKVKEKNT